MHGNRDFLMGLDFASRCDATLLPDPTILEFNASSYLLSHGDALCTDDEAYIRFREIVRDEEWQADFLAKPLPERRDIARKIRAQSSQINQQKATYADVNESKALEWLNTHGCDDLIHGHTHQPASHRLGNGQRHVLSDWDAEATPARAQILRLTHQGFSRLPL
jgi:UDP-2,3-diacylglucosamine hydrolase